ncbi:MAG TPA: BamA/TamA family outer membrane protein [Chitinophagaceae bacterium]|nr:BamA/TamA family outer membrane protein [Chitinophagaceae bacterium]
MINPPDSLNRDTSGQKDLVEILLRATHIHIKKPPQVRGQRIYYSLLPIGTNVPGGGRALVTSTQVGFYLGDRHTTYLSNITFSPSTNFKGQFVLPFRSNIWTPDNAWNFNGDTRFSIFPQFTWGLGGEHDRDKQLMRYSYLRFYHSALKRIKPYLFAGVGYDLDYHIGIHPDVDSVDLRKFAGYNNGIGNHVSSFSSGITLNLLYDTRNNPFNPLPGFYYNAVYRVNPQFLGSNNWWHSLYLDARKYIPLSSRGQNVLAAWTYLWTTLGSSPPYLDLPGIKQDPYERSGRGFYPGRYSGKSLFYLETEYRRDITANGLLGFVVFANLNSVTEPGTRQFAYVHPAVGTGLRIKFNKLTRTNMCIDYGVSKGYSAVYFSLGEAF